MLHLRHEIIVNVITQKSMKSSCSMMFPDVPIMSCPYNRACDRRGILSQDLEAVETGPKCEKQRQLPMALFLAKTEKNIKKNDCGLDGLGTKNKFINSYMIFVHIYHLKYPYVTLWPCFFYRKLREQNVAFRDTCHDPWCPYLTWITQQSDNNDAVTGCPMDMPSCIIPDGPAANLVMVLGQSFTSSQHQ